MTLSLVMPYRPGEPYRDRAWEWLERRWRVCFPELEIIIEGDDGGENPGHFNHPLAINRGVARATGDVVLIGDCDTGFDPEWVLEAHALVHSGKAPWVLPLEYRQISEPDTDRILHCSPASPIWHGEPVWSGSGICWSGLVVVPRESFEVTGGYDERFAYWGADDACFGITTDTLWGQHVRLPGVAYHLYHPQPLTETYGHGHHREQHELTVRYQEAAGDPDAVREVRFG